MSNVNLIMQGKGGVGKSLIASLIAQYCSESGSIACYDTDPINTTFTGYDALKVKHVEIMEGDDINQRNFDSLIEEIANAKEDNIIIDNGASTFVPLASYINSNGVIDILNNMGHTVYIHTVVTAGQAMMDTLAGFDALAERFGDKVKLVVWLNSFWGEVTAEGKQFTDMAAFNKHKGVISSVVLIPEYKKETFGQDLSDMLTQKLTFAERIEDESVKFMEKQRLISMKKDLFENMSGIYKKSEKKQTAEA